MTLCLWVLQLKARAESTAFPVRLRRVPKSVSTDNKDAPIPPSGVFPDASGAYMHSRVIVCITSPIGPSMLLRGAVHRAMFQMWPRSLSRRAYSAHRANMDRASEGRGKGQVGRQACLMLNVNPFVQSRHGLPRVPIYCHFPQRDNAIATLDLRNLALFVLVYSNAALRISRTALRVKILSLQKHLPRNDQLSAGTNNIYCAKISHVSLCYSTEKERLNTRLPNA